MRRYFLVILILSCWLLSYCRYSSVGIDQDHLTSSSIITTYYRIRCPGDGSLWLGNGYFHAPLHSHTIEPFDLAGTLLQTPRRRIPNSIWNNFGFWRIQHRDPAHGTYENWFAIPSWLLFLPLSYFLITLKTLKNQNSPAKNAH